MASKKRIGTLQDVGQVRGILKTHVKDDPASCQQLWQYKGMEEVAENYADFLMAVATTGNMLSRKVLSKALRDMYEGDRAGLDAFAKCMVDTLSGCRAKLKNIRSGDRTHTAVVKICESWPTGSSSSAGLPEVAEVASSGEESESVVSVGEEPTEADAAKAALANAMALFGAGEAPMQRSLAKEDSIVSIGSSQPTSPKAAGDDAMIPLKADNPLLSQGACLHIGAVWPPLRY